MVDDEYYKNKAMEIIKKHVKAPGDGILGQQVASLMDITTDYFWELARILEKEGRLKIITTNMVTLPEFWRTY